MTSRSLPIQPSVASVRLLGNQVEIRGNWNKVHSFIKNLLRGIAHMKSY